MEKKVCIIEGCNRPAVARGLCHTCYQTAHSKVKDGVLSWENLIDAGLALKGRAKTAPRGSSPFAKALSKALSDQAPAGDAKLQAKAGEGPAGRDFDAAPTMPGRVPQYPPRTMLLSDGAPAGVAPQESTGDLTTGIVLYPFQKEVVRELERAAGDNCAADRLDVESGRVDGAFPVADLPPWVKPQATEQKHPYGREYWVEPAPCAPGYVGGPVARTPYVAPPAPTTPPATGPVLDPTNYDEED